MTTEPKLLTEAEWLAWMQKPQSTEKALTDLRARGLIAEEPVDPLRVMADKFAVSQGCMDGGPFSNDVFSLLEQAKAIGMELAPRKELTRAEVGRVLDLATDDCGSRWGDDFAERLYFHFTEALQ